MSTFSWRRAEKVFQKAIDLDPKDRGRYLRKACKGNELLLSTVQSLLSTDGKNGSLLEGEALERAAVYLADEEPLLVQGQNFGQYKISKLIGKGGMGEVYLARDETLNRLVALKLLASDQPESRDRIARLRREAQSLSALNHPNIVTIYEYGCIDTQHYLATEIVEGETLSERLSRGRLTGSEFLDIAIQLATALAAAHRAGILHRDIKPANIMLRPDGLVKVLDFGLAKTLGDLAEGPLVQGGMPKDTTLPMGTPRYMSPEQIIGIPLDGRSDIFSLGAVFYEMLSGRRAFEGSSRTELTSAILDQTPRPLNENRVFLKAGLSQIVERMLKKDREHRYKRAEELLNDLESVRKKAGNATLGPRRMIATGFKNITGRPWAALALFGLALAGITFVYDLSFRGTKSAATKVRPEPLKNWMFRAPISSPRSEAAPAVLDDALYVAGGWNGCTPFSDLEVYDDEHDTWKKRASMMVPRGAHGVASLDGKIYAVGGSTGCKEHIADVESYDPDTNKWTGRAPLPSARAHHVVASANGKLFSIGGISEDGRILSSNTQYDPSNNTWTEMAPIPTPRIDAGAAVANGQIYVIGGNDLKRTLYSVEVYDPNSNSWKKLRPTIQPHERFAAAVHDGMIYAIGGANNSAGVEAYDPKTDTWSVVATLPSPRYSSRAVTFQDSIYVIGGHDGAGYLSSVLELYREPLKNRKPQTCPMFSVLPKANMPTPRRGMTAGIIDGVAYVVGGYGPDGRFLSANESFNPKSDRWAKDKPLPSVRQTMTSTGSVVIDGRLYVIGGNADGKCSDLNQAFDPKTGRWTVNTPMPTPRCHLSVIAYNDLIFAIGGTDTSGTIRYSQVEVYNPSTNKWSAGAPMPTGRWGAGVFSSNGLIYIIGGVNPTLSPDELTVVEAYDPVNDSWVRKSPLNQKRALMATGVLNGSPIVITGQSGNQSVPTAEIYDPVNDRWTWVNTPVTARLFPAAVVADDQLYIFGGHSIENPSAEAVNEAVTFEPCINRTD